MPRQPPRYSKAETARRGDEIYERKIRAQVETGNQGKLVAIDVDTEAFAVAETVLAACRLLSSQHPDAEIWVVRIGHPEVYRIGMQTYPGVP